MKTLLVGFSEVKLAGLNRTLVQGRWDRANRNSMLKGFNDKFKPRRRYHRHENQKP